MRATSKWVSFRQPALLNLQNSAEGRRSGLQKGCWLPFLPQPAEPCSVQTRAEPQEESRLQTRAGRVLFILGLGKDCTGCWVRRLTSPGGPGFFSTTLGGRGVPCAMPNGGPLGISLEGAAQADFGCFFFEKMSSSQRQSHLVTCLHPISEIYAISSKMQNFITNRGTVFRVGDFLRM